MQGESQALSTNLPLLYRDIEIWKKDCLVIMPMNLAVLTLEQNWINQRSSLRKARGGEEALRKGFDVGQILHAPPNLTLLSTY